MKIFVAMTSDGWIPSRVHTRVVQMEQESRGELDYHLYDGEGFVGRARNKATTDFLLSKEHTHLMCIDSDQVYVAAQIRQLAGHDRPIVGGFYAKKRERTAWVANRLPGEEVDPVTGLLRVLYMPSGFLLIKREVIERMVKKRAVEPYDTDDGTNREEWEFWPIGVPKGTRRYLGEDWQFCRIAAKLGYNIYGDTRCIVGHYGGVVFPLAIDVEAQRRIAQLEKELAELRGA